MKFAIFHHAPYQRTWEREGLLQIGPQITNQNIGVNVPSCSALDAVHCTSASCGTPNYPLIYYTDNFYLQSSPLRNISNWPAPRILVCGDLHHGNQPLKTLQEYLNIEKFDAVLLLCNPNMLNQVRNMVTVPVRFLPPSFFKYASAKRSTHPIKSLLHVGSIGPHHPHRCSIVNELISRSCIPFVHQTTASPEEAALLYAKHAIVLNIPLNHDLNHRVYEIMAAGAPQIIFGSPEILGDQECLALRSDLFWVSSINEIEKVTNHLLHDQSALENILVPPPPEWELDQLIKAALAPYKQSVGFKKFTYN